MIKIIDTVKEMSALDKVFYGTIAVMSCMVLYKAATGDVSEIASGAIRGAIIGAVPMGIISGSLYAAATPENSSDKVGYICEGIGYGVVIGLTFGGLVGAVNADNFKVIFNNDDAIGA